MRFLFLLLVGLGWAGRRRRHVDPAVQAERFKDDPNPKWRNCPSPKKVFSERPNGKIHCFLSTCQLVCEQPGFVIDGKEKIKCKGGKKKKGGLWEWKGQLGTCLATCKTITAPNGMQSRCKTSKKSGQEQCTYTCDSFMFDLTQLETRTDEIKTKCVCPKRVDDGKRECIHIGQFGKKKDKITDLLTQFSMNTRIADSCESSRTQPPGGNSTHSGFISNSNGDVTPPETAVLNRDGDNSTDVADASGCVSGCVTEVGSTAVCEAAECRNMSAINLGDTGSDVAVVAKSGMGNTPFDMLTGIMAVATQENGFQSAFQGGFLDLGGPDGTFCTLMSYFIELAGVPWEDAWNFGSDLLGSDTDSTSRRRRQDDEDDEDKSYSQMLADYIVQEIGCLLEQDGTQECKDRLGCECDCSGADADDDCIQCEEGAEECQCQCVCPDGTRDADPNDAELCKDEETLLCAEAECRECTDDDPASHVKKDEDCGDCICECDNGSANPGDDCSDNSGTICNAKCVDCFGAKIPQGAECVEPPCACPDGTRPAGDELECANDDPYAETVTVLPMQDEDGNWQCKECADGPAKYVKISEDCNECQCYCGDGNVNVAGPSEDESDPNNAFMCSGAPRAVATDFATAVCRDQEAQCKTCESTEVIPGFHNNIPERIPTDSSIENCSCVCGDSTRVIHPSNNTCTDDNTTVLCTDCKECAAGAKETHVRIDMDCVKADLNHDCVCECADSDSDNTCDDGTYICINPACEVCNNGTAHETLVKPGEDDCPGIRNVVEKSGECCPEEEEGQCADFLDACVNNFSTENMEESAPACFYAFNEFACTAPDDSDDAAARMLARVSRSTAVAVQRSARSIKADAFRKLFKTRSTALRRKRAAEKKMRKMRRKRRDGDDDEEEGEKKNIFAIMMEGDDKYITTDLIKLCAAVYNWSPIGQWSGSIETLITAGFTFVSDFIIDVMPGMDTKLPKIDGLTNDDGSALTLGSFLNDTTLLIANGLAKRYNVDDEGASEMLTILQVLRTLADMFLNEFFDKIKEKLDFSALGAVPACLARNLLQQCTICIDAFKAGPCNTCPCDGCNVPDELCSVCFTVQNQLDLDGVPILDTFPENIECNIQNILDSFSRKVVEAMQITLEAIPIVGPGFLMIRMNADAVKIVTSIYNSSPLATFSKKALEVIIEGVKKGAGLVGLTMENLDAGEGSIEDMVTLVFQLVASGINAVIGTVEAMLGIDLLLNPKPWVSAVFPNLAMDVSGYPDNYEEVRIPQIITSTMLSVAAEFAIAYNFYDGGYPPIDLWGIITGIIGIIRDFFTNLIDQIMESLPFKKGWHEPLLEAGITEEYVHEFMANKTAIFLEGIYPVPGKQLNMLLSCVGEPLSLEIIGIDIGLLDNPFTGEIYLSTLKTYYDGFIGAFINLEIPIPQPGDRLREIIDSGELTTDTFLDITKQIWKDPFSEWATFTYFETKATVEMIFKLAMVPLSLFIYFMPGTGVILPALGKTLRTLISADQGWIGVGEKIAARYDMGFEGHICLGGFCPGELLDDGLELINDGLDAVVDIGTEIGGAIIGGMTDAADAITDGIGEVGDAIGENIDAIKDEAVDKCKKWVWNGLCKGFGRK